MKCPSCGASIPEGHLYCEVCGKEIKIVPEFDPEIENRINESLSGVADDLKDESIFFTKKLPGSKSGKNDVKPFIVPAITAVGILIAFVVVLILIFGKNNTPASYEEQAEKYYVAGKFDEAVIALNNAIEHETDENITDKARLIFKKFEYLMENNNSVEAIKSIMELTDSSVYGDDIALLAVDKIVSYYEGIEDYLDIHDLLIDINLDAANNKYIEYLPQPPKIYPDEGIYEEATNVRLSSSSDAKIYYTVNGGDPDAKSILYENELILDEEGNYNIKAVTINKYGISSDISSASYVLQDFGPADPVIMEDSGDYSQATMIVAVCDPGCRIFYTTDGTDPDNQSNEYISPISMPVGTSTFKFVVVDEEDRYSDIVEKNYHLSYTTMVSVDQARESIKKILVKLDILLDMNGSVRGEEGHYDYIYDGDIEITGSGEYYKFTETHVFNDGRTKDTGLLYAVNKHDGKVNRLGYDSSGNYTLITISNR